MKISLEIIESFYNIQNCYESNMQHANIPSFTVMTEKSFLRQHLRFWLNNITNNGNNSVLYLKTKYGLCHMPAIPRAKEDGRRELPKSIIDCLVKNKAPWKPYRGRVTLTWIVCFLIDMVPDINKPNWDVFQCSHLCVGAGSNLICLNGRHLCWEPAADNQSRGSKAKGRRICCVTCKCGKFNFEHIICMCYKLHGPPCYEPMSSFK